MEKKKKMNDITKIVIAMLLGSVVGIIVGKPAAAIGFVGDIWLNLMKMFLVPIVVCMLVKGISSMDSPEMLGRLGLRFLVFYLFTTVCASVIGIGVTKFLNLGNGVHYEAMAASVKINELPGLDKFFTDMFSTNIFKSFTSGDMMQVLIISCFIGVAIVLLPPEKRDPIRSWFCSMADLMTSLITIALKLAPIGVFCLMAAAWANMVPVFWSPFPRFWEPSMACFIHLILIYCLLLFAFTGISPITFAQSLSYLCYRCQHLLQQCGNSRQPGRVHKEFQCSRAGGFPGDSFGGNGEQGWGRYPVRRSAAV